MFDELIRDFSQNEIIQSIKQLKLKKKICRTGQTSK